MLLASHADSLCTGAGTHSWTGQLAARWEHGSQPSHSLLQRRGDRGAGPHGPGSCNSRLQQLPAPARACQESPSCVPHVPGSVLSANLSGVVLPPTDPVSHKKKQDLRYAQSFHSFRNLVNITEDLLCANAHEGRPESGGLAHLSFSHKLMAESCCMFCKNAYLLCQEHDGNNVIKFLKIKENNQLPHHHFYPMNPSFFFLLFCTYRRCLSVTA